ncbi:hypothetical protein AGMMS49950_06260 [Endomicrobiia bacterium]|nr:hypothetical protein AGMMS49950_06260 [Endomicrobiia bacterium]
MIVKFFNLPIETIFSRFGNIAKSMSFLPQMPTVSFELIGKLFQPALTIAILAEVEPLLYAVVADGMIGKKHRPTLSL